MLAAIDKGPVSVSVEADKTVFQHYKSGVLTGPECGTRLDHAVVAVGYGSDYYIVRNSWGPDWGDHGYINIGTEPGFLSAGVCGILKDNTWPTTA